MQTFLIEGVDSEYLRFYRPNDLFCNYSTRPSSTKQPEPIVTEEGGQVPTRLQSAGIQVALVL